ncbi:MAG: hypothetical protein HY528_04620 [Chloroflexi bacterium]|nr:hypothetical protein [Chloroflexota bacterium]
MKTRVRKATMTNKERIEALLRREKPDRVPFSPGGGGFVSIYTWGSITDEFTKPLMDVYQATKKACHDFDWVFAPTLTARRSNRGLFGGEVKPPTSKYQQGQVVVKYPADTAEEVMALKTPDPKTQYPPEVIDFFRWVYQDEDSNKPFHFMFSALMVMNTAADIAGYDKMCKWMIQKPEAAHRLVRLAADYYIATAQYVKDIFGVDGVLPWGPTAAVSNQLVSPKHFEQFTLPVQKEVHQKVLAMGFKHLRIHICGEQNLNLPYWQQIPMGDPGIIWFGNEIDLETAAKYFPNDIIEGNLDTTIIQIGTPEEVYQAAGKVIEQGKSLPTGFILAQACSLPARAPVENMRAITRALNDFGWYD